jgi:hypothetical protein
MLASGGKMFARLPAPAAALRAQPRLAAAAAAAAAQPSGWQPSGWQSPAALCAARRHSSTASSAERGRAANGCPFSILRIEPTPEFAAIKRAYFEAAARCHPDVMPACALSSADPETTAREFHLVTAAYQTLQDPQVRQSLADEGRRAQAASPRSPSSSATAHPHSATAARRDFNDGMAWRREQQEMEWHEWRAKREEVMQLRQAARRERLAAAQRERLQQLSRWQASSAGYSWANVSPEY